MSYILYKNLATSLPVAITLIKYNSNSSEENEKKRGNQFLLSLLSKKAYPKMIKMLLTLDNFV